ncbi:MAG: DUF484 family protein [Desulfarculus sp.]|nr:DUF484 family protein [Desulfarculus sp.]
MLSYREVEDLLTQARRNEEIQRRLDQVEEFLLVHHDLHSLLKHLGGRIAQVYELELVTLALDASNQRLRLALEDRPDEILPPEVFTRPRKELRLILGNLESPFLSNRISPELCECFFPGGGFVASLAIIPLWVRGEFLGTLNLGSGSSSRYQPLLDTHFLRRLGKKTAAGLEACLLREQTRLMERREAAVEMAGAACHELAQPLTTMTLQIEMLLRATAEDDPRRQHLVSLQQSAERLGELVHRISQVSQYVTRPYAQGLRIIDVEAASQPPPGEE